MTDFTPTPEQDACVSKALNSTDNFAVIARAGAAKTSTLILIAEALKDKSILSLAFNKAIATEMEERLPSNCTAKTLHQLGYSAWSSFIPGRCKLVKNKVYQITKAAIEDLDGEDKKEAYEDMSEIMNLVSAAKSAGYIPDSYKGHWKPIMDDLGFEESLPMEPSNLQLDLVKQILIESWKWSLTGEIDFDDMVYCPALCSVSWPLNDVTLIDEAQDLSPLNHHMLRKIVRKKRIIAVGDPLQAIYGFRGASEDSMDRIISAFDMDSLYLTVTFRCPRAGVRNVEWIAPDMQYPDWAIEGTVSRPVTWSAEEIHSGDAIICRSNAPLFSIAMKLIECDKLPEIAGRDIGAPIIKLMKKLGNKTMLPLASVEAIGDWKDRELRRARDGAKSLVHDKAAIMLMMVNKTANLGDAIAYLQHLLERTGRIKLMTGHKAKGLEFKNVFFLDAHLCRLDYGQDKNIKYVIETRFEENLTYIQSDAMEELDDIR